jgi:3-carboxy-cis,cis-muconate cycloisomerase
VGCGPAGQERDGVLRFLSLELVFSDPHTAEALSDEKLLAAMARFEAALARASTGLVPLEHAETIARACESACFDVARLANEARHAGTLAIPFVKELTAQVPGEAARYVHFGATSQDVIDTAVVVCLKEAAHRVLVSARRLGDAAARLADRHRDTPTVARTLLQPATPVPFGWKAAVWLSLVANSYRQFRAAAEEVCVLQFGGPAGTLAAFGSDGELVSTRLAERLGLRKPPIPWHSARDRFARFGAEAAILAGAAGKIARDVSLLMQPEVGEAFEPASRGRGGSSALPHKRNPAACVLALEASQRAPALAASLMANLVPEHERGLGQWQAQWLTLRSLVCATASGVAAMAEAIERLEVRTDTMAANLERTQGLVFSEAVSVRLAQTLGKSAAHTLTEKLCARAVAEKKHLREVLLAEDDVTKIIPAGELEALFEAKRAFGSAKPMIDRVLAIWRETAP